LAASAFSQTYNGSGFSFVDASQTDVGYASGTISIAGSGATIASINSVTLTGLTHTWVGDLEIDLWNPVTNLFVDLTMPPDGAWSNFNGTYTFVVNPGLPTVDEAVDGQDDLFDLPSGTYAISTYGGGDLPGPRTDFSTFTGLALDGDWVLEVWDYAGGDTGGVASWSMNVTPVPEPATMGVLAFGVVGLLAKRRKK
jgi:hypothetical protein